MFEWKKNNRACTTTWTTLMVLDQISKTFDEAGEFTVENFTFWKKTASSDMKSIMAKTLARQIDNVFLQIRGAKYEDGSNKTKAINDIVSILTNGKKTIRELAELNDNNYLFWKEAK